MKGLRVLMLVVVAILFSIISTTYAQNPNTSKTVLTHCVVIDCTGKPPMEDMTVVITGGRIAEIKRGIYDPSPGETNVRVFNLEGGYVLPGLWNVHTHIGDILPDPKNILANDPLPASLIRAGRNCMDALRRGFIGIRNVGDRVYIDLFWRDAFNSGVFVGPRIFGCGNEITATGGHGTEGPFGVVAIEIDGPYEMRSAIREHKKHGVNICAGSDSNPVGEIGLLEIEQLVFSGMTEMQALIAATRNCADLCGVLNKLGTVEEGKLADIIVVSGNPLDNISNLRKLEMVFKDGKPVNLEKDEGQTSFWELYFLNE